MWPKSAIGNNCALVVFSCNDTQEKPLPAPTMRTNNKRAGRRVRKANESRRVSDLRRKQMRIKFGEQEEEIGYSGKGLGMLGQEGSGSLRATVTEKKSA